MGRVEGLRSLYVEGMRPCAVPRTIRRGRQDMPMDRSMFPSCRIERDGLRVPSSTLSLLRLGDSVHITATDQHDASNPRGKFCQELRD